MKRAWIDRDVLVRIMQEAEDKSPLETGGVLVGYFSADDNDVVITEMIGPGPEAKHRKWSFTPDYAYHREEIGKIFDTSDGLETYLGDWHSHPAAKPYLSFRDKSALRNIAKFPLNYVDHPIMLVSGEIDDEFVPRVWRIRKGGSMAYWGKWEYLPLEIIMY